MLVVTFSPLSFPFSFLFSFFLSFFSSFLCSLTGRVISTGGPFVFDLRCIDRVVIFTTATCLLPALLLWSRLRMLALRSRRCSRSLFFLLSRFTLCPSITHNCYAAPKSNFLRWCGLCYAVNGYRGWTRSTRLHQEKTSGALKRK